MSTFIHSKTVLAGFAQDASSLASIEKGLSVIAKAMSKNDEKATVTRTERAGLILGGTPLACAAMTIAGRNEEKVRAGDYAEMMGLANGSFSKSRAVYSVALFMSGAIIDGDACVNQSTDDMKVMQARLEEWWSEHTSGAPGAPGDRPLVGASLARVFDFYTSDDGERRLDAVQKLQETFGSIEKIYTIMTKAPAVPADDDGDDDGEPNEDAWRNMLVNVLTVAKAQGATDAEVIFLVRKFQNDGNS